jgi:hypothetical protein
MARDLIVERERTLNTTLFLIATGNVVCYGKQNPLNPLVLTRLSDGDYLGDDIAVLVQGHEPSPRWYTSRCSTITRVHILNADVFLRIVENPGLKVFKKNIARYGVWMFLKYEFLKAIKSGKLRNEMLPAWLGPTSSSAPRRRGFDASDNAAIAHLGSRVEDLEAKLDRVLHQQSASTATLQRLLKALEVRARATTNAVSNALPPVPTVPSPGAFSPRSFNLDDFLEPISNGRRRGTPSRPSDSVAARSGTERFAEFFCRNTGDLEPTQPEHRSG